MAEEIKVIISPDVKNIPTKARERMTAVEKAGGFEGELGTKRKQTLTGFLGAIDELIAKGKVGERELKELDKYVASFYETLGKAAATTKNLSNEMRTLIDMQLAASKKAKQAEEARDELLRKGKTNETGTAFTTMKGYNERIAAIGVHKQTKGGGISKNTYTDFETISANMAAGKATYVDASGKPLADNPEWIAMITEMNKESEKLRAANMNLTKFTDALNAATQAVQKQATKEGDQGNPLPGQISSGQIEDQRSISELRAHLSRETGAAESKDEGLGQLEKQTSSLNKAFKQFTIYAIALRAAKKAMREAINTIKELDRSLTEQAMVTGLTRKQTYGLLKSYQEMASNLGATTKEVSSTMTEFLRQGRSINDSLQLTEAAISAAKVAGISASESVNYLTTAVNGFQLAASEAMRVSDRFAAVAASAAVSYEEVATALSKVAAQANLAGMSIDYTTALLTKGIETTREAPETIGTALKTVIARMREMSDYGETLEGDTDVNNVETQLAYIGIALRDNNGELRSTEDVLNELGGQWDELNSNQQAAIAKALAGTRQQSRLIAMMQDYERVIELQQISERSAGATMAQMATYMEGMDAAINKVSVAWETIVSNIADNNFIIGLVNALSGLLEYVGLLFENTELMIPLIGLLIFKGAEYIGLKLQEQQIARETQKINNEIAIENLKERKTEQELLVQKIKAQRTTGKVKLEEHKANIERIKEETILQINALKNTGQITNAEAKKRIKETEKNAKAATTAAEEEWEAANQRIAIDEQTLVQEEAKLNAINDQIEAREREKGQLETVTSSIHGYADAFKNLYGRAKDYVMQVPQIIASFKKVHREAKASNKGIMAKSAAYIPVVGWAIGLILEGVAIGGIIASAVSALSKWIKTNQEDKSAENINELSAQIYNLNKTVSTLDTAIDKFDELDKKIIKTKQDSEEMASTLQEAADSLSEEEKAVFDTLQTNAARRDYLEEIAKEQADKLSDTRKEQREAILNLSGDNKQLFLESNESKWAQNRDAMYALNNATLYAQIDALGEVNAGTEQLVQNLLEELDVEKALAILGEENGETIRSYINAFKDLDAMEVFNDSENSIKDRIEAFREMRKSLANTGDVDAMQAFKNLYSDWNALSTMTEDTINLIDKLGATVDEINDFAAAMEDIGITGNERLTALDSFAKNLQGSDLKTALEATFGTDAQEMLLAYEKAFGTTVLNIGQNVDKFRNSISSFYETATKWNEMNETERTQFLSENSEVFKGDEDLLRAFQSGDYNAIYENLLDNQYLQDQRELRLAEIENQLQIELARDAETYNQAMVDYLKAQKAMLENTKKLYLVDLELRLEQQNNQLDAYKDMLQKESDALTESLEKRKEAYEKYFEDIKEEQEDEDYEEQAQTLISNISKLGSSTNADAIAKSADLQKQLEELEKERLETLRERAQEQIISNIDDEVSTISDNLDKLLSNEQALLAAMTSDNKDSASLIASMMSAQYQSGNNTELGMQSYLQDLQSTFASIMPNIDWNNVGVEQRGEQLILNIQGKEIILSENEQQNIYDAVSTALRQVGKY